MFLDVCDLVDMVSYVSYPSTDNTSILVIMSTSIHLTTNVYKQELVEE